MYIFANDLTETALTTPCMFFLTKHFFAVRVFLYHQPQLEHILCKQPCLTWSMLIWNVTSSNGAVNMRIEENRK